MPYKNKEERLAYHKEYYKTHRSEQLQYFKEYQNNNKNRLKNYTRKYREDRPWLTSYMSAEQRCNNIKNHNYKRYGGRGILFRLTKEEVSLMWNRDGASSMKWATLDRINNDGNYEFSNCRFVEMSFNSSRRKQ